MRREQLAQIKDWFSRHVSAYQDMDPDGLKNIRLKEEHTAKVLGAMELLAAGEGLSPEETCIACAVAILHDAGRFPQYRRWRTFRDSESDNHARLGIEVIREQGVLNHLSDTERLLIEEAIRFHNLLSLPQQQQSPTSLYIRLLRDADKLDIWRVFLDYFQQPESERASAAGLGLPNRPEVTPVCLAALADGAIVSLESATVLNDFVLMQISWAYDLNTTTAFRLLQERSYLQRLAAELPDSPETRAAVNRALAYVQRMARG